MCYGQVDAKVLEREALDRLRAARPSTHDISDPEPAALPPELTGGLAGVVARIRRALRRVPAGLRIARG